jgi:Kef-type K+ transport system membrane component KefB
MLETVAWFGALFLLLETGLEVDVSAAWRHVTVVSIVGKFAGAWLGTFGTSLSRDDRLAVGIAFTPGGVTEILLAKVALEHHIFTEPVFVAVV